MSELKVIYLGPACQAQGKIDGREWCQDDVWDACECGHESVRYVLASEFDRVSAERDALQQRLNAADQRIDELTSQQAEAVDLLKYLKDEREYPDDFEQRLKAATQQ